MYVLNLGTLALSVLKLEYSQATDRQMDGRGGDPLTPDDLKTSSMSYISELVEGLHSKNVCFQFDHSSSSHSQTSVHKTQKCDRQEQNGHQ